MWKRAVDAGRSLPAARLAAFPGLQKKTRAIESTSTLEALRGVIPAADYEAVLTDGDRKTSLVELMVRAGADAATAQQCLSEAEARLLEKCKEQVAMRTELAVLLGRDETGLKLRCARVNGGSWIFSRYDCIAFMLEPEHEGRAHTIWERMLETHPELESSASSSQRAPCGTFKFPGERQQETPVASIRGIVEMLFLVPGKRAAAFRRQVASVFVRYVGGDPSLLDDVEQAAHVQSFLREQCPENPATAFGEAVVDVASKRPRKEGEELAAFVEEEKALKLRRLRCEAEEAQAAAEAAKERASLARAQREEGEKAARAASEKASIEKEEAAKAARFAAEKAGIEKERAAQAARAASQLAAIEAEEAAKLARLRTLQAGLNAGEACAGLRLPTGATLRALDLLQTMMFGATARTDEGGSSLGAPLCLQAELRRAGLPDGLADASSFGKKVKAHFERLFPGETLGTRTVHVNGHEVSTNAYFERHRPAVEAGLEDLRAAAAAAGAATFLGSSAERPRSGGAATVPLHQRAAANVYALLRGSGSGTTSSA